MANTYLAREHSRNNRQIQLAAALWSKNRSLLRVVLKRWKELCERCLEYECVFFCVHFIGLVRARI